MDFVTLSPEEFVRESVDIVKRAQEKGVILRILGALAIYIRTENCLEARRIYDAIPRFGEGKPLFTDLDLMAYSSQRKHIIRFFQDDLGFKPLLNPLYSYKRLIYQPPEEYYHVDVFFDKLEFSHDVNFGDKPGKGRLDLDFPTITVTDLALEKLQIHQINMKDIVDLIVLFRAYEVMAQPDRNSIDAGYIASILSDDWGFWFDCINNLNKVKSFVDKFYKDGKLSAEDKDVVVNRIDKLLKIIEETPKTKKWIKRSKIGTSEPWYREVEEIER